MAAPSCLSEDWHLADNTPAIIQWSQKDVKYLGCETSCQVLVSIGVYGPVGDAFIHLRIPVGLKNGGRKSNKTILRLYVRPEQTLRLVYRQEKPPSPVVNAFVGKLHDCKSMDDIIGLHFSLREPALIVGPAGLTSLSPKTKAGEHILTCLHSLGHVNEFSLFIPRNRIPPSKVEDLCDRISSGVLKSSATEYSLTMLYGGSGGQVLGALLDPFERNDSDGPPSYDELALTSPSPPPHRRKRLAPTPTSPPPAKRHSTTATPHSSTTLESMKQKLASLTAKVVELQGHLERQSTKGNSVEDDSVPRRLEHLETEFVSFKSKLESIEGMLQEKVEDIKETVRCQAMDDFEEILDERIGDAREETSGEINYQLDEMLTDIKGEMQQFVKEELRELIDERLEEVVNGCLESYSFYAQRN